MLCYKLFVKYHDNLKIVTSTENIQPSVKTNEIESHLMQTKEPLNF